jgi:hypothetical protein
MEKEDTSYIVMQGKIHLFQKENNAKINKNGYFRHLTRSFVKLQFKSSLYTVTVFVFTVEYNSL